MILTSMGDSMEGLSEMGERRSRVASNSSLAQVPTLVFFVMVIIVRWFVMVQAPSIMIMKHKMCTVK